MSHIIEMLHIRKGFPGIVANDDISLQVKQGEIHAILGENGAGKSTLMSMLVGLHRQDSGQILVRGEEVSIHSPKRATALGIGMVHQNFQLVHNFTVAENILLGKEGRFFLGRRPEAKRIRALSEKYGLDVDPAMTIGGSTADMALRVEILKMLYRDAEVLIFDEPTASLTYLEIINLMHSMRSLATEGKTIIFVTDRIHEVKGVADRCTIIREGKLVGVVDVKKTSQAEMFFMMAGRPVSFQVPKKPPQAGRSILELYDLEMTGKRKSFGLKGCNLSIKSGEILGIAGGEGNGQTSLIEAITGLRQVEGGTIILDGNDITHASVRKRNEIGLGHIPSDRQGTGLVMGSSLSANIAIKECYHPPFSKWGIIDESYMEQHAQDVVTQFGVLGDDGIFSLAHTLSEEDRQKLILGRELTREPPLLIAVEPTRALGVDSSEYIHSQLVAHRDKGLAVLLVSSDLDEIFNLSDRIAVMYAGQFIGVVNTKDTDEITVGMMMLGIAQKDGSR